MAEMMNTSRAVVNRLLNPDNSSLTLSTLESATHALGKRLNISIIQKLSFQKQGVLEILCQSDRIYSKGLKN